MSAPELLTLAEALAHLKECVPCARKAMEAWDEELPVSIVKTEDGHVEMRKA